MLRVVEIANGLDCNTCCGTHVPSLGHLQAIQFLRIQKVKPKVMRVSYAAGKRLLSLQKETIKRSAAITNLLSCNEQEYTERLTQLLEDKRRKELEIKDLKDQLCAYQAKEIVQQCETSNNVAVVDLGSSDMQYMQKLSAAALEQLSSPCIVLLLVQGAEGSDEGSFLLSGNVDTVDRVGMQIATVLGGRGGGKNGKFQGKGIKIRSALPEAKRLLMEAVAAHDSPSSDLGEVQ